MKIRSVLKNIREVHYLSESSQVVGVYGFLGTHDGREKQRNRNLLRDMIRKEIQNSKDLTMLLDSGVESMATTDQGETPLVYGTNLKELLLKRIELMSEHIDDEPYIDPDYIEKNAGELIP